MKPLAKTSFWKSFKKIITMQFLQVFVFSVVLSIICIIFVRMYIVQDSNTLTLNYGASLERIFTEIDDVHFKLINNPDIKVMSQSDKCYDANEEFNSSIRKAQEFLSTTIKMSNAVRSVYVYNQKTGFIFSNIQDADANLFFDQEWVGKCSEDITKPTAFGMETDDMKYISFLYPIYSDKKNSGIVAINVDVSKIDLIFKDIKDACYITNSNGDIVYSTNLDKPINVDLTKHENFKKNRIKTRIVGNRIINVYSFQIHKYFLTMEIKNSGLININLLCELIIVLYTAIVFFAIHRLLKKYAQHYFDNISEIVDMLSIYESTGDAINKTDEFQYIRNNVSILVTKNEQNEIQLSKKIMQLKKTQLDALQTQISPHFILNSLNVVNLLIIKKGDLHHEALKINQNIAKILTHVLSVDEYYLTVKEEIECTKDYLEIGLMRKNHSFDVKWDIDEDCLEFRTVKFILQPIVENSIEHGFSRCKKKGMLITIKIEKVGSDIEFTVRDNGNGMTKQKLEELNYELNNESNIRKFSAKENLAILNIHKRIQLIYGDEYGVSILKSDEEGTIIKLITPIQR